MADLGIAEVNEVIPEGAGSQPKKLPQARPSVSIGRWGVNDGSLPERILGCLSRHHNRWVVETARCIRKIQQVINAGEQMLTTKTLYQ